MFVFKFFLGDLSELGARCFFYIVFPRDLRAPVVKAFIFLIPALLFIAGPAQAQAGCCQLLASSCMGQVTQTYCEQELKGMFQDGVACRSDTGKCGVVADDDIPNSLIIAMGLVFLALLIFVVAIIFFARRARKSMETKY